MDSRFFSGLKNQKEFGVFLIEKEKLAIKKYWDRRNRSYGDDGEMAGYSTCLFPGGAMGIKYTTAVNSRNAKKWINYQV